MKRGTQEFFREWARMQLALPAEHPACHLAERIKEYHEENTPEVTGVYADLVNAALESVNWVEIAKHLIAAIEEERQYG